MLLKDSWTSLKFVRSLTTVTELIYNLSSVMYKPIEMLKENDESTVSNKEGSRILSASLVIVNYLDRIYLPLSLIGSYNILGPMLTMAVAHPYFVGVSLFLLSDLPIALIIKNITLILSKVGRWTLRKLF